MVATFFKCIWQATILFLTIKDRKQTVNKLQYKIKAKLNWYCATVVMTTYQLTTYLCQQAD